MNLETYQHLLLHRIGVRSRGNLLAFAAMTLAFLGARYIGMFFDPASSLMAGVIIRVLAWLILTYALTQTFASLRTRQGRIAHLMLPATAWQKYLVSLLISTVGTFVLILAAWLLSDLLWWLLTACLGYPFHSAIPAIYDWLKPGTVFIRRGETHHLTSGLVVVLSAITFPTMWFSFNVLGGLVFHKNAFVKTMVFYAGYTMLGSLLGVALTYLLGDSLLSNETFMWCLLVAILLFQLAVNCVALWYSWQIFRRRQVVLPSFFQQFRL